MIINLFGWRIYSPFQRDKLDYLHRRFKRAKKSADDLSDQLTKDIDIVEAINE